MKKLIKKSAVLLMLLGMTYSIQAQEMPKKGPEYFPFGSIGDTGRGVFGSDDRVEAGSEYGYADYTRATATMINKKHIRGNKVYAFNLRKNLEMRFKQNKFDTSVKFLDQPTCGLCTGFLIAPDILVTAGHCVEKLQQCKDYEWIFDYTNKLYYNESKKYITVPASNRFKCKEIIAAKFGSITSGYDYAVIRLDRKTSRTPYRFRTSGKVASFSNVYMIGSPTGLPLKLAKNSYVFNNTKSTYFINNLDGFPGNSGGPVFNKNGFIEGIHVRGAIADQSNSGKKSGDYYYDAESGLIKTVKFASGFGTPGSQAHRITHIPADVLRMAIYENLSYAIEMGLDERLDEWLIYNFILKGKWIKKQESLVIKAMVMGNIGALNKLLQNGASVSDTDKNGKGLLHHAVSKGDLNNASALLKMGLSPNLKDNFGNTPIHMAANANNLDMVKQLVENGGDVNVADNMGNTLLHCAVRQNNMAMVEYVYSKGANTSLKNKDGKTAAKYAKSLKFKPLYKYLKKK